MGRPRVELDLEILRLLRTANPELGWRSLARLYYRLTSQDVSFMTLKRALLEAELVAQESDNSH